MFKTPIGSFAATLFGALLFLETHSFGVTCKIPQAGSYEQQLEGWISAANATASEILVYIPGQLMTAAQKENANLARTGFLVALFHTSFEKELAGFQDVSDGHCALYKVDLQKVWGNDWNRKWDIIKTDGGIADNSFDPARQNFPSFSAKDRTDLQRNVISAHRLAYGLTFPANYVALVDSPEGVGDLRSGRDLVVGGYKNGIPCGPRITVTRYVTIRGQQRVFFLTGDPSNARANEATGEIRLPRNNGNDLPRYPGRQISGGEGYHQLPNGFFRYFVFRNPGTVGTKALASGVIDPANFRNNFHLVTGRSCISCHSNGVRGAPMDSYGQEGWSSEAEWEKYFTEVRDEFRASKKFIVDAVSDGSPEFNRKLTFGSTREPVAFLIEMVEGKYESSNRRYRPYGRCEVNGVNKFAKQIEDVQRQIQVEVSQTKDDGTKVPTTEQPSNPSPQQLPTTTPGISEFTAGCGQVGCHTNPSVDRRLKKAVPATMWFIAGDAPIDPRSQTAQQIKAFIASVTNPAAAPEPPPVAAPAPAQPAQQQAPAISGESLFISSCATSGCHQNSAQDTRLARPVPANMWAKGGIDPNGAEATEVKKHITQLMGGAAQ